MKLIGQLSKDLQIPVHTIRYYENLGLICGKQKEGVKSNNYKYYDNEVAEKLDLIVEAKSIGFTLAEIRELIDAWHGNHLSVEQKKNIIRLKIAEVDKKITDLMAMKQLLAEGIQSIEAMEC